MHDCMHHGTVRIVEKRAQGCDFVECTACGRVAEASLAFSVDSKLIPVWWWRSQRLGDPSIEPGIVSRVLTAVKGK